MDAAADAAVVQDDEFHRQVVAHHGLDFHAGEAEGAVALHGNDGLVRIGHRRGDGEAEADAHGAVGAGVQPVARQPVRHLRAANVHRVGALADNDGVLRQPLHDVLEGAVVVGGGGVVVDHGLHRLHVGLRLLFQQRPPRRFRRIEPLAIVQSAVELADNGLAVAHQRHLRRHIGADFGGIDVQLDDAHIFVEARRQAEVHDPVQPSAQQNHQIGLAQRRAARRAHR